MAPTDNRNFLSLNLLLFGNTKYLRKKREKKLTGRGGAKH